MTFHISCNIFFPLVFSHKTISNLSAWHLPLSSSLLFLRFCFLSFLRWFFFFFFTFIILLTHFSEINFCFQLSSLVCASTYISTVNDLLTLFNDGPWMERKKTCAPRWRHDEILLKKIHWWAHHRQKRKKEKRVMICNFYIFTYQKHVFNTIRCCSTTNKKTCPTSTCASGRHQPTLI